jgi:hypothetical protein
MCHVTDVVCNDTSSFNRSCHRLQQQFEASFEFFESDIYFCKIVKKIYKKFSTLRSKILF